VDVKIIPDNRMLSLGITATQKAICEKSIRQYGLLTPIVLLENPTGELMTLSGENELEVLKEMNVTKADVFITKLQNRSDTGKVILWLSSFQKGLNPLCEGLLLRELLNVGNYTQIELAQILMKSKSWVSKRLALAEQLEETVAEMVLSKKLCSASAQDIARLPKEFQHKFALEVFSNELPKSSVEKLVVAFNNKATSKTIKEEIIANPSLALFSINQVQFEKCSNPKIEKTDDTKFDGTLRLLLKLIAELELNIAAKSTLELQKHSRILPVVQTSIIRFFKLLDHCSVSLRKLNETSNNLGGDKDVSC
jgi:ParB family chromosome partitioning protein